MRTLRMLVLVFLAVVFLATAVAQVQGVIPTVLNGQYMGWSPDGSIVAVAATNLVNLYKKSPTAPGWVLTSSVSFTGNPEGIAVTATNVVMSTHDPYSIVNVTIATGGVVAAQGAISPQFQGPSAALANGTVLFGSDYNSFSGGGVVYLVPKLGIYNPQAGGISFYDSVTPQSVIGIYAIRGTNKAITIWQDSSNPQNFVYSFAIVDGDNMNAPVNLVPLAFKPSGIPGFSADGKIYLSSSTGAAIEDPASGTVTPETGNLWAAPFLDREFAGDNNYFFALTGGTLFIMDATNGKVIWSDNPAPGNGPYIQMFVTRDSSCTNTAHVLLLGNGVLVAYDVALPPSAITSVVNAASLQVAQSITGDEWLALFGTNLACQVVFPDPTESTASAPFPSTLNGTTVTAQVPGSSPVALMTNYFGPNQLNVLTPANLPAGVTATLKATSAFSDGTSISSSAQITTASSAPALFQDGNGNAYVVHLDGTVNTTANPGETVLVYGNGLGAVQPGAYGLMWTTTTPLIAINGISPTLLFFGLAPGFVGLYQINLTVPFGISSGEQPLTIQIGSSAMATAKLLIGQ